MQKLVLPLLLAVILIFPSENSRAVVTLPPVLTDHMVLQQGILVPIWGKADPNESITITFRDQTKTATADAEGKWMVKLDPLQVGDMTPTTLTVAGSNTITLKDVLVGEVWVGSGQSNLDSPVNMYGQSAPLMAAKAKKFLQLRLYHSTDPSGWHVANNPDLIGGYSAQLFYFGMLLQQELNVPVGVMEGAVAGSPSAPFLPQTGFNSDPGIQAKLAKWDAANPMDVRQKKYEADLEKWKSDVTAAMAAGPAAPPSSSSMNSPSAPLAPSANAPSAAAADNGSPAVDFDHVPKDILAKHPKPWPPTRAVDIKTGDSFEKHIRPMIPYAIRGVLWDQGEGGSGLDRVQVWQEDVMAALISGWRKEWGQGDFPWLYVQKPSGGGCALNPADPNNIGAKPFEPLPKWVPDSEYFSSLRHQGYSIVDNNKNTFLVIASDLDNGVHPVNKPGYATRDLQVALGAVYGKPVEYYGPKFDSCKMEGNKARVSFTHVGKGLTVPAGQTLQGFSLAGADKKMHWADAVIDGQTVVVSCSEVPNPVFVQYAWTWPLAWANLFNIDGLPAMGFSAGIK